MESLRSVCGDLWLGLCCYSWVTNPRAKYQVLCCQVLLSILVAVAVDVYVAGAVQAVRRSDNRCPNGTTSGLPICIVGLDLCWLRVRIRLRICNRACVFWWFWFDSLFFSLSKALNRCVWQFNRKSISFKYWSICYNVVSPSTRLILAPSPPLR